MKHGKAVKKPVEIDWFEWQGDFEALKSWIASFGDEPSDHVDLDKENHVIVNTLEGHSYCVPSPYVVIRGTKGEYYPHEHDLFFKNYTIS